MNLKELTSTYQTDLIQLGYVASSAKYRTHNIKEFFAYCELNEITEIQEVTSQDINNYYQYLLHRTNKNTGGKLSLKTAYDHTRSIEILFNLLVDKGELEINPMATLKFSNYKTDHKKQILTQDEIKELYQATETLQERAILSLGYGCGLRVGEVVKVNINDVNFRESILIVPNGKYNKRRIVPMSSGVKKDLENYYFEERIYIQSNENEAFILNKQNNRKRRFNDDLKAIAKRTKNIEILEKNITMHCLRHSIATHLLEQGLSLEQVREFLGHAQLESTEVYTRINQKQLKEMLEVKCKK